MSVGFASISPPSCWPRRALRSTSSRRKDVGDGFYVEAAVTQPPLAHDRDAVPPLAARPLAILEGADNVKGLFGKWAFQIDAIQIDVKHRTLIERDDNAIILASGLTPSNVAESERKRKHLTVVVRFDFRL